MLENTVKVYIYGKQERGLLFRVRIRHTVALNIRKRGLLYPKFPG